LALSSRYKIADFADARQESETINQSISHFEEDIGVSFNDNFWYALIASMGRALMESDTRGAALTFLRKSFAYVSSAEERTYLTLPLVVFGDDLQWVSTDGKILSFGPLLFQKFADPFPARLIARYLATMFGHGRCFHRLGVIADCIIYGAKTFPDAFSEIKKGLADDCFKILDAETNIAKSDKIASVLVQLVWVTQSRTSADKVGPIGEDALTTYIGSTIDGIKELFEKRWKERRT
jgi:hypothetical protein